MAIDLTPEQKETGKANFQRVVGRLAEPTPKRNVSRRQFMKGLIAAGAAVPVSAALYFGYNNDKFKEKPVRAALIGAGDEGGVLVGEHNPAYLQFVAYSDIRPSNQKRIFEGELTGPRKGFNYHYGSDAKYKIKFFEKYEELLADDKLGIEAVVIALPLHLHAPVAIAALKAGKHVLCEKLMAWNIKQCKDMIRWQDRMSKKLNKDLLLAIGHQRHYSMLYAQAVDTIKSGVLGDVKFIRASWHRNNAKPKIGKDGKEVIDPTTGKVVYGDGWRPDIKEEDRKALEKKVDYLHSRGFKSLEQLVRWRLYMETGGGLMAELGSHQLDACSIFLSKMHPLREEGETTNMPSWEKYYHLGPLAVSAIGGKYFYEDDREIEDHVFCTFEFPGKNYTPTRNRGNKNERSVDTNDKVIVTYSSISTNAFEPYGECIMGSKGTMLVQGEQEVMLWGKNVNAGAERNTAVTVQGAGGSKPALEASGSTDIDKRAVDTGKNALGAGPVSRGYREEMEHFAYCIRMREQGNLRDRDDLQLRCDGVHAMADAIIALTSNQAMRGKPERIEFQKDWYDPNSDAVPDADMKAKKI